MIVITEIAKVYRGGNGRRYFTKYAAYRDAARRKIKSKCECGNSCSPDGIPEICWYHEDQNRFQRLLRTLVYFYARADRKEKVKA